MTLARGVKSNRIFQSVCRKSHNLKPVKCRKSHNLGYKRACVDVWQKWKWCNVPQSIVSPSKSKSESIITLYCIKNILFYAVQDNYWIKSILKFFIPSTGSSPESCRVFISPSSHHRPQWFRMVLYILQKHRHHHRNHEHIRIFAEVLGVD